MEKWSELQVTRGQLTQVADELTSKQCEVIANLLLDKEENVREGMADQRRTLWHSQSLKSHQAS